MYADLSSFRSESSQKHVSRSFSAYIRIVSQIKQNRPYCYAVLNWNRGKVNKTLGVYPYLSAAPLLDITIFAAMQPGFLTDEELARLLRADKSYRPFAFRWQHYQTFLEMQPVKSTRKPSSTKVAPRLQKPGKVVRVPMIRCNMRFVVC
jgi:hypothetical protein